MKYPAVDLNEEPGMPTREERIERYQQLIRVLQGLPEHERRRHFKMDHWGQATSCGTAMCAAGFAGRDPWFRRRGFKFALTWLTGEPSISSSGKEEKVAPSQALTCGKKDGWEAVGAFFGEAVEPESWCSNAHPSAALMSVFHTPKTVTQVVKAAKARIREIEDGR